MMILAAQPALAQDFIFNPVLDPTAAIGYASIGVAAEQIRQNSAARGGARPASVPGTTVIRAFARPAPAGRSVAMAYPAPSAQFRRQQVADLLDRASRSDPQSARTIRAQFVAHDYAAIYDGMVRPYGLAGDDAANALAAYMLLGWMIVHEGQEPTAAGIRGVRAQAAQALADPRLSAPDARARLGEEFKILFVTIHAGWQGARREGALEKYAAGITQIFRRGGAIELRAARIGPRGFEGG
jgi:hypothetical protein